MSIVHSEWAGNMYYYHILVDSLGQPPSEHLSIAVCMYALVIMGCLPRSRGQERHMYIRICRIVSVYNLVNYMHIYSCSARSGCYTSVWMRQTRSCRVEFIYTTKS